MLLAALYTDYAEEDIPAVDEPEPVDESAEPPCLHRPAQFLFLTCAQAVLSVIPSQSESMCPLPGPRKPARILQKMVSQGNNLKAKYIQALVGYYAKPSVNSDVLICAKLSTS